MAGNTPKTRQSDVRGLEEIPNIGPAIASKLRIIGIRDPAQMARCDPYELFEQLEASTGSQHDPCVLDVFLSAVRYLNGAPAKPWWKYTAERQRKLSRR